MQARMLSTNQPKHGTATHYHWQPGDAGPPIDFLVAVYSNRAAAEQATRTLHSQGVMAEDIFAYHGPAGLKELHDREPSSLTHRFLMAFDALAADDGVSFHQCVEQLRLGRSMLLVYGALPQERHLAESALRTSYPCHLMYLGRWTSECL
jgi:hypothetical protein